MFVDAVASEYCIAIGARSPGRLLCRFSDGGMEVSTTRGEAGVGEAPRHEVAGSGARYYSGRVTGSLDIGRPRQRCMRERQREKLLQSLLAGMDLE